MNNPIRNRNPNRNRFRFRLRFRLKEAALPLEGHVHTWGQEIYFEIPVDAELEDNAVAEMTVGAPTGPRAGR